MNYKDALQVVIGEATRLNEAGTMSDFEFEMLECDVYTIDGTISEARSVNGDRVRVAKADD